MVARKNFAVLGGDVRQISLVSHLARAGASVCVFGLPEEQLKKDTPLVRDWQLAIADADIIVLPLPASPDGIHVHMPLVTEKRAPTLAALFEKVGDKALIAGGRFSPAVKEEAMQRGCRLFDFFKSEELQKRNAIPTAEGAVEILMSKSARTVHGLPVAVTGYGRVAKALCHLLLAMGAVVTVGARKSAALEEAALAGCRTVKIKDGESVQRLCRGQAAVFNTVPAWLFTREVLTNLSPDLLMIDLASAPGGVDAEAAGALGRNVIWALSLPGKYAPVTAGEIIADAILSHLCEEGML